MSMESFAIGSDHAGFPLKEAIVEYFKQHNIACEDIGCYSADSVDYPDIAAKVVRTMEKNGHSRGILCCGSGIGVSISANRFPGIRAALANDLYAAKMSRLHNDANILCMGSRVIAPALALEILETWMKTPFEGGRHQRRVDMMDVLTEKNEETTPC